MAWSTYRNVNLGILGFLLGIWFGTPLRSGGAAPVLAWGILMLVGLARRHRLRGLWCVAWVVCCLAAGTSYVAWWRGQQPKPDQVHLAGRGAVAEPPSYLPGVQQLILQDVSGYRVELQLPPFPRYQLGDQLSYNTHPPNQPPLYPDAALRLERFKLVKNLVLHQVEYRGTTAHWPLLWQLYKIRITIEQTINQYIPEPESSFLSGVLLGSSRAIPQEVQAELRQTGTSHIIAISGANITIVLGLLLAVLPLTNLRRQFWATCLAAGFITLLTGASASVVRGAVVAMLGQLLRLYGRPAPATSLVLVLCLVMLIGNPLQLRVDVGFQLSLAAFTGIIFLGKPLAHFCRNLPEVLRLSLSETTAATIATAPVSYFVFGKVSLLGLLVNPCILWLLPPLTALGFMLLGVSLLPRAGPFLAWVASYPLWGMLHLILQIIHRFARL